VIFSPIQSCDALGIDGPLPTAPTRVLGKTSSRVWVDSNTSSHRAITLSSKRQSNGVCSTSTYKLMTLQSLIQYEILYLWHLVRANLQRVHTLAVFGVLSIVCHYVFICSPIPLSFYLHPFYHCVKFFFYLNYHPITWWLAVTSSLFFSFALGFKIFNIKRNF